MAGLEQIPAYIRIADDQGMLEMALVENIQRQELDAIEVALSYKRLIEECNLTQEQMSDRIGKNRSTVTNYLRLLKLPPLIQAGLRDNMISMGHARALIAVEDEEGQLQIYKETIAKEWSVRDVENAVKQYKEGVSNSKKAKVKRNLPEAYSKLKTQLKGHFDTNVDIALGAKGRGKIVIPFTSSKDLERIVKIMNQQD
jgi:ParB family chromosome partitioning protein